MVPTSLDRSRWLWTGISALLLLATLVSGAANPPTWAGSPDVAPLLQSPSADIEPFSFQLEHLPTGEVAAIAGAPVQPTAGGGWSDLMTSGFEQDFVSEGWTVQGTGWGRTTAKPYSGSYSAAVENFSGAPATKLVYGGANGFSLADLSNATLNFAYWLDTETDVYFGWAASSDGVNFYGSRTAGRLKGWLVGSFDLKLLLGDDSVWIAFTISGSGSGAGQSVYLDDVAIAVQKPYRVYLPVEFRNYRPSFHDNFSSVTSGWPVEHFADPPDYAVDRDYSNGAYWMKLTYIWFHRIFASPAHVHASGEFTLQTDLMYDFGDYRAEWGVILEASDDMKSYYLVAMYRYGPDLLYRIRRRIASGAEVDLVDVGAPWFLERISWKWSSIRIVRQGDQLRFYGYNPHPDYLRWELVNSVTAPPLSGTRIGATIFSTEQGAEAYFDNFHLWHRAIDP